MMIVKSDWKAVTSFKWRKDCTIWGYRNFSNEKKDESIIRYVAEIDGYENFLIFEQL